MVLLLLPVILSVLVLAAHFLRAGNLLALAGLLALVPLLALRRRWVALVARYTLWLGTGVWVYTAIFIAADHIGRGQPWQRASLIFGGVALLTLLSSLVFGFRRVRVFYQGGEAGTGEASAPAAEERQPATV
ncbi:MAG TPA: hypothetical protein VF832_13275 [Longimicrobiales bacterium]